MADRRNTRNAVIARNAAAAAVVALAEGGRIRIYSGVQPLAGGPVGGTLLWESDPLLPQAFNPPVDGVASMAEPQSALVLDSGRASWYRVTDVVDETLWDGSVGDEDSEDEFNIEVSDTAFVQGGVFILSSLTYEAEAQGN